MAGPYLILSFWLWWMVWLISIAPLAAAGPVHSNNNTRPAGRLEEKVLNIRLYADVGSWRPEGPQGAPIEVAAFGEEGADLSVPGPLIRVREGTTIVVTLRNALGSALRVNGLCTRPSKCDSVSVAPGASQEIRFTLNAPGTYFYWATTGGPGPVTTRQRRDTQLGGAIVVDPGEGLQADRVFVISIFGEPRPESAPRNPTDAFAINGSSWPYTEKLHHKVGDRVRWRIINLSHANHAMHLHGIELESYFDGVPGWGGQPGNLAPPVAPGQSFVAKFAPPRAGTFIYHTHWHKDEQLGGGLYGPLIVLEPGERYDPETDHIVVIGLNGVPQEGEREPFALNGGATPAAIVMRAGVPIDCALSTSPRATSAWWRTSSIGVSGRRGNRWRRTARSCQPGRPLPDRPSSASRSARHTTSKFSRRGPKCCGWKSAAETGSGCCKRRSSFASHRSGKKRAIVQLLTRLLKTTDLVS